MTVGNYLKLTAFVTFTFGLGLILLPAQVLEFFGGMPSAANTLFMQFLGSTLFGYSVLNWQAAKASNYPVLRMVARSNLATLAVATVLSIWGQWVGALNGHGYLLLLVHAGFGLGFAICIMRMRRSA